MFELFSRAFADRAFRDFETPEDLFSYPTFPNRLRRIHWKDRVMKQPVMRNQNGKPMSTTVFRRILAEVGRECGYREKIIPYSVRRFVMNAAKSE
jgi:uncharacterized protein DUF3435